MDIHYGQTFSAVSGLSAQCPSVDNALCNQKTPGQHTSVLFGLFKEVNSSQEIRYFWIENNFSISEQTSFSLQHYAFHSLY